MLWPLVQGHPLRARELATWQVDSITVHRHLELSEAHSRAYGDLFPGLVAVECLPINLAAQVLFTEYLPCPGIQASCQAA